MTELENTKTDLSYTSNKLDRTNDQKESQDKTMTEMHENYKKTIGKHEKEKNNMKD